MTFQKNKKNTILKFNKKQFIKSPIKKFSKVKTKFCFIFYLSWERKLLNFLKDFLIKIISEN